MVKQPLVSVIIPVYNTGKLAMQLIDTLLTSDYQNLEIIAIDDGSTDDSLKFLRSVKDPLATSRLRDGRNSRLRILSQKNSGASSARNLGIAKSTGDYLAFFDSDDSVDSEIITRFVQAFTVSDADVILATCAYRYHRVRQNTTEDIYISAPVMPYPDDTFKTYILRLLLADGRLYAVINKLFRADIIRRHRLCFDTNLNFAEDTKFVLQYLDYAYSDIFSIHKMDKTARKPAKNITNDMKAKNSFHDISWRGSLVFLPEPLYHYNYGTATSTVAKSSLPWKNWQISYDNLSAWLDGSLNGSDNVAEVDSTERKLLHQVRMRWRISHALAVTRANLSTKEKLHYASLPELFLAKIALLFRK